MTKARARKPMARSSSSTARAKTGTAKRARASANFIVTARRAPIRRPVPGVVVLQTVGTIREQTAPVAARAPKISVSFEKLAALSPEAREHAVIAGLSPALIEEAAVKLRLSQRSLLTMMNIAPTTV